MSPASPQRSASSPKCAAYARIAASTASMCFRSDSLAVYSCCSARASSREGSLASFVIASICMGHLRSLSLRESSGAYFPFTVPAIRSLRSLDLDAPVTFFVGENGSGKSTLREGIALAAKLPTIGSAEAARDETLEAQRSLARALKLTWNQRAARGFFLRAEDFFGYAKELSKLRAELLGRAAEIETEYADRSAYARGLALGPTLGSVADLDRRYGSNLDENSHGQSFLKVFQA